nr:MAG TPA: hypothetical protein [Caudoviricetes sp.]
MFFVYFKVFVYIYVYRKLKKIYFLAFYMYSIQYCIQKVKYFLTKICYNKFVRSDKL